MVVPSLKEFLGLSKEFPLVPIAKEVTELALPSELLERLLTRRYPFLLESARPHPVTGRYSFLGWDPFLVLKSKGDWVWIEKDGKRESMRGEPLKILQRLLSQYQSPKWPECPFTGGAVGYLSYEIRHFFEKLPNFAKDDLRLPDLFFLFVDRLIAFDHVNNKTWLIVNAKAEGKEKAYQKALEELEEMESMIRNTLPSMEGSFDVTKTAPPLLSSNLSCLEFKWMVERAKSYIRSGDIFQANLSQRLQGTFSGHPYALYEHLRNINPSPFAAYFDFGEFSIVSSSPERLVRKEGVWIETRPIAGTRPRGKDSLDDLKKRIELMLSEKERAEHLMLIDLERNDLGRVCTFGSVRVNEMMVLEDYSHVIHIVSNIRGQLREGMGFLEILRALFPGGTITGVPKVRCMEIIDELEPVARGIYTGSIGYLGFNGEMDLNLVIRTFVLKEGKAYIQVGSGIVADSDPLKEYEESLHKAQALVEALKRERTLLHA